MQVFSQKCITLNKQYKTNHAAPKERVTHTHTKKKITFLEKEMFSKAVTDDDQ